MKGFTTRLLTLAATVAACSSMAQAEQLYALTSTNRIIRFDSTTPGTLISNRAITGIAAGDKLIGLDLRASDGRLYTMGTSGNIYRLATSGSGYVATNLGAISTTLTGSSFGFDFNPVPDRLRVVSDVNQNLRLNPVTPPGTTIDGSLTLNGSPVFDLFAVAYTNNRRGALSTVLYGIDARSGGLVRSTNANAGTYVTTNLVGSPFQSLGLALDNSLNVSFDISGGTGKGFFSYMDGLYGVNLSSGAPSFLGSIGAAGIIGLTAATVPEPQSWALLISGFGLVGLVGRRQRRLARVVA